MSFDAVRFGTVLFYPYLWAREQAEGETEGRKSRPVAVGVRLARRDGDGILLLPITSSHPDAGRLAVEIPTLEKRRAGLDEHLRLWIILDEYNFDVIGRSFYLTPEPPIGQFGRPFFLGVMKLFVTRRSDARPVNRGD